MYNCKIRRNKTERKRQTMSDHGAQSNRVFRSRLNGLNGFNGFMRQPYCRRCLTEYLCSKGFFICKFFRRKRERNV